MADIAANLGVVRRRIEAAAVRAGRQLDEITVVAVTKTVNFPMVVEANTLGVRHFGENRVQEAAVKFRERSALRELAVLHLIGHLQTNKVKTALAVFDIIQSVDTVHLAKALSAQATRRFDVLLEVNVAGEATKYGFLPSESSGTGEAVRPAFEFIRKLPFLRVVGLMTVAPQVPDPELVRPVFRELASLAKQLELPQLSMGMTDDFEVAIEEGATMIRLGRAIFGERPGSG